MIARTPSFNRIIVAVACAAMVACGSEGEDYETVPVSGKVTVNGKPVTDASLSVVFSPMNLGPTKTFTVKPDGSYEGEAAPDESHVTIVPGGGDGESGSAGGHAMSGDKSGQMYDSEGKPTGKKIPFDIIYTDERSTLRADVKDGGENKFDFEIGKK